MLLLGSGSVRLVPFQARVWPAETNLLALLKQVGHHLWIAYGVVSEDTQFCPPSHSQPNAAMSELGQQVQRVSRLCLVYLLMLERQWSPKLNTIGEPEAKC